MPYSIEQISPRRWAVMNTETGKIHSYGTTLKKAEAQVRLLESKEKIPDSNKMTYRQFIAENMKGKKFGSPAEVRAEMKRLAEEWKKKSGSGIVVVQDQAITKPKIKRKSATKTLLPVDMPVKGRKKKQEEKVTGTGFEPPLLRENLASTSMDAFLF